MVENDLSHIFGANTSIEGRIFARFHDLQ